MKITVLYSCDECKLVKVSCEVNARDQEDIVDWMDYLIKALAIDHHRRSPNCHPKQLTNLMIPIHNAKKIGGPAIQ